MLAFTTIQLQYYLSLLYANLKSIFATMRCLSSSILYVVTALLFFSGVSNAFTISQSPICSIRNQITSTWMSTPSEQQPSDVPANLVNQQAFITAIDVLKKDMGMEIIPDDQR